MLNISVWCTKKASPERRPEKAGVEARKVYSELAEGWIIQKLPLSS